MAEGIKVGDFTSRSRILDLVFPVGAVYHSFQPKSPAEWLGGTWELLEEGRSLIAASDPEAVEPKYQVGAAYGEAEHTLTIEEMPPHSHPERIYPKQGTLDGGYTSWGADTTVASYVTSKSGGGQPHNNMPPCTAAYIWRRIA